MAKDTRYIIFIERHDGDGRSYPSYIAGDGFATQVSGKPERAAVYVGRDIAGDSASRWGKYLVKHGYDRAAKLLRVQPAGGGMCTVWRFGD